MQYNTKNKRIITEFFDKNSDNWFTVEQIMGVLGQDAHKSTVYRQISELCAAELLIKEYSDEKASYVYKSNKKACHNHFHFMCVDCGQYVHIEDKETEAIIEAIGKKNKFSINKGKTVFYGVCQRCMQTEGI